MHVTLWDFYVCFDFFPSDSVESIEKMALFDSS